MNQQDLSDIEKRQAHLDYITNVAQAYNLIRGRRKAHQALKTQIEQLEIHIANELQEFLNG